MHLGINEVFWMKRVACINGYWCTNIGNSFFNLGAEYVLKQVFGDENVHMIFDQTAYINHGKKNIPYAIDYMAHLNVDYVVLLGPVLTRSFLNVWKKTLDALRTRGIGYMILSAGMMKNDAEAITQIKAYFAENPPYAMTTRDRDTYQEFKDCVPRIYDGICFAFFVPDCVNPVSTDLKPVMAVNFDKIDEPYIFVDSDQPADISFDFQEHKIGLKFKSLFSQVGLKTDRFTDALVYLMSPLPRGKRPEKAGEYTIIRTDHRFSPMFQRKAFRYANSFCADVPQTYANIYAEAELTLSDRVHACAIALAYGNAAYLFAKTGRSALLKRVGAEGIEEHPVKIDLEMLKEEKRRLIEYLRSLEY